MKVPFEAVAAVLTLACACLAADKQSLPKDLPPYGAMKQLAAPHVTIVKLDNGLTVWLVPEPGFPKVAVTLAIRGGYTADAKDRPGFADLIAATVTQGTRSRSAKQVAEDLEAVGGDLSGNATPDAILIETSALSSKADAALQILADVMQQATFADQEVAIAKSNLSSALQANEADPSFLGRRALYRALFGQHPYAITSAYRRNHVAKTTAAELRTDYARRFRPDRALLIAVGDFSAPSLLATIRASFSAWKPGGGEASPINATPPASLVSKAIVYVPRANSVQTALYLGTLGPNRSAPDYAAARIGNALYGGMFGSRLVNNIREDKGYTYSPGARA